MNPAAASEWMLKELSRDGCLYQDDVVDHLLNQGAESLLRENSEGNLVVGIAVLDAFRDLTPNVVWVRLDRYWRFRVPEDEEGREARG